MRREIHFDEKEKINLFFWQELDNKSSIKSLDDLKEKFPNLRILRDKATHKIYGTKTNYLNHYIAYECMHCEKLIAGKVQEKDDEYYCSNCEEYLGKI